MKKTKNPMNLLDKAKGFFSPTYAYKTAQLRNATALLSNGGLYDGAKQSPHYNISTFETTEDEDIVALPILRTTSRDHYRNSGFYQGVIKASIDHTIGSGLRSKSAIQVKSIPNLDETTAKNLEDVFDSYFNNWSKSKISDITGQGNFYTNQRLIFKCFERDGDSFVTLPLTKIGERRVLQLDLIGAENIASNDNRFVEGIRTNKNKRPVQYSILQSDGTYKKVKAYNGMRENILHLFDKERAKSTRGIPLVTATMRDIDSIDQYMKYELTAAKLSAIFFGSIKSQTKSDIFGNEVDFTTGDQKQTAKNTVKENTITQLAVGDELDIHQQGRDNPNYQPFVNTSMQKVSAQTRIPLEIILTQFTSSYSASRASMLLMQKFVKPRRDLFIDNICNPIRNQVITWGILQGDIIVPNDFFEYQDYYLNAMWIGDPMGSVDPQKDVKAKSMMVDSFFMTGEQATVELGGGDYETNIQIRDKELDLIAPLKEKIQKMENTNESFK